MPKILLKLRELGHKYYQFGEEHVEYLLSLIFAAEKDMSDSQDVEQVSGDEEDDDDEMLVDGEEEEMTVDEKEEEQYLKEDQVRKYKFDFNGHTSFLNQHPDLNVKDTVVNSTTAVAPGERKIPTNIMTDPDWDIKTFPCSFPDGRNGMGEKRSVHSVSYTHLTLPTKA